MYYKLFLHLLAAVAMSALLGACELAEDPTNTSSDADTDADTDGDTDSDTDDAEPRDFYGSCVDSPSLMAGMCMSFVGETYVDTDKPIANGESVCEIVDGTFSATDHCPTADLVGICRYFNLPADTDPADTEHDIFYYSPTYDAASAEDACNCATCEWEPAS